MVVSPPSITVDSKIGKPDEFLRYRSKKFHRNNLRVNPQGDLIVAQWPDRAPVRILS